MPRFVGLGPKLGVAMLFATLIISVIGRDTAAQAPAAAAEQQLAQLRDQVASLERRIAQLEKEKGGAVSAGNDTSSRDPRLAQLDRFPQIDQRLAALEQAAHDPIDVRKGNSTLTAPFTIVDAAGKPIMRVTEEMASQSSSRGLYIYSGSATGAVAHVGALSATGGGRIYVTKPGQLPEALMFAAEEGPAIKLSTNGKTLVDLVPGALSFVGTSGSTIALFGSKGDRAKGYLEINDGAGTKMVEAGSLDSHKGYVLATPYRASTSVNGDPSVLKGGGGK